MEPKTVKHTCRGKIYWGNYLPSYCSKTAKYEHDGKWYCGVHYPIKVADRKAKRDADYETKCNEKRKLRDIENAKYLENNRLIAAMSHFCKGLTVEFMEMHQCECKKTLKH